MTITYLSPENMHALSPVPVESAGSLALQTNVSSSFEMAPDLYVPPSAEKGGDKGGTNPEKQGGAKDDKKAGDQKDDRQSDHPGRDDKKER